MFHIHILLTGRTVVDEKPKVDQQEVEDFWQDKQYAQGQRVMDGHAADEPEGSHQ